MRKILGFPALACLFLLPISQINAQQVSSHDIHDAYPAPLLPFELEASEADYDDSLPQAIVEVYASNPDLAASRYDLRAIDDEVGIALSRARPSVELQVAGGYDLTLPGDITDASRTLSDRLNFPNIERNDISSQLVIDQPLWTGGRASGAVRVASAASLTGQESLRSTQGDILLNLVEAYADVRRDTSILSIRRRNVEALGAMLDEITARREAGQLTRTDIAQGEVQYQSALVQYQAAIAGLQSNRATFAAIVGREPGSLAPLPDMPGLPASLDEAFDLAEVASPELAAAIARERESRARIALARAEGMPQITLRGTAGTSGPLVPFHRRDQDAIFTGRATITIPLVAGGRIRSQVVRSRNRNAADELRVEATRRQVVQGVVTAWNQWASAEQNALAQEAQLRSARVFYEGTMAEYREGLRSTFDVLFAQSSMREAQIALLSSTRDSYVARAALLRRMGILEAGSLLEGVNLYDPEQYARRARNRSGVPWGPLVRGIDRIGAPGEGRSPIERLPESEVSAVPDRQPAPAPIEVTPQVLSRALGEESSDASVFQPGDKDDEEGELGEGGRAQ